ncbi:hypothetical protein BC567DRAFT_48162 [Phyllosticta citribraziliensis]
MLLSTARHIMAVSLGLAGAKDDRLGLGSMACTGGSMINGNAAGLAPVPTGVWMIRDEEPRATGNKPTAHCTLVVTLYLTGILPSPKAGSGRLRTINSILLTRQHHHHDYLRSQPDKLQTSSSAPRDEPRGHCTRRTTSLRLPWVQMPRKRQQSNRFDGGRA